MSPSPSTSAERTFPRVLLVYQPCINVADQHGASIRAWFSKWPRESLAQIYSGQETGQGEFCGAAYKLSPRDRWFGKMFYWLKGSSLGKASIQVVSIEKPSRAVGQSVGRSRFTQIIGRFFLNSGLWEYCFRPRLSDELIAWVQNFKPDVIYCQGYSLGFTWLPLMLTERFGIPICFQTGDDWPETLYSDSPLSFCLQPLVRIAAKKLIRTATVRFAIGKKMADEYEQRYGVSFEPLMICDDYERFAKSTPTRIANDEKISVVYAGSLGGERWKPLADLCLAAAELQSDGLYFEVTGLVSSVPQEGLDLLRTMPNLTLLPAPGHDDLPGQLRGADILFLPEPFEPKRTRAIRLSVSTKAHLYMMSDRPILVYAPASTGTMSYCLQFGWGCCVSIPDRASLKVALSRLATDEQYRQGLVWKGTEVALRNHDSSVVCEVLRRRMCDLLPQSTLE